MSVPGTETIQILNARKERAVEMYFSAAFCNSNTKKGKILEI